VVSALAESFRVLAYDRRGRSASERPAGQGSVFEDVDDLAGLIDELGLAPAHVAGNSAGAAIVLDALAALWQTGAVDQRDRERPFFGPVVDTVAEPLPRSERITIDGADHVPHISVPGRYVELVRTFARRG